MISATQATCSQATNSQAISVQLSAIPTEVSLQNKTYIAGMPQLSFTGLSENWLLKECGHRHWQGLAQLNDQQLPEFSDENGHKSYAAFTAVRISHAKLNLIQENQLFNINSHTTRAGLARHYSKHNTTAKQLENAQIEMLSTFVYRQQAGNNQSVKRANFASSLQREPSMSAQLFMQDCKKIRSQCWLEHLGITRLNAKKLNTITFTPCPNNDFNGANFLYFASFQAFVDRAEWAWFKRLDLPQTWHRELYFYGNINVGDSLTVQLSACIEQQNKFTYWCEILNQSNVKIADIFTIKVVV